MPSRAAVWKRALLAGLALASGLWLTCVEEPGHYFPDSVQAPVLDQVALPDQEGPAYATNLQGGVSLRLSGSNLADEHVSVRVGEANATIVATDPSGQYLTVETPPGPLAGGRLDVTVSTSWGVAVQPEAFEYRLTADDLFEGEAGSLQVLGREDGSADVRIGFWPSLRPRWAGSMFTEGALYYLPGEVDVPVFWTGPGPAPARRLRDTVPVADVVTLDPVAEPDLSPLVMGADIDSGAFFPCGATSFWRPATAYDLTLSGGVIPEPIEARVSSPASPADERGALAGLLLDDLGVAQVDFGRDLVVTYPPDSTSDADGVLLLVELVVAVPEQGFSDTPAEVGRVVVQADDAAGEVVVQREALAWLPSVDTTCALIARRIETAVLEGDLEAGDTWNAAYLDHGCTPSDAPVSLYPWVGYIRLTRHLLHRVPLGPGMAGCPSPGACSDDSVLVVDMATAVEVPATFSDLSDCEDLIDNDGDGLVDADDPGCDPDTFDDSEVDQTGMFPCDDGLDNDGDGLADYSRNGEGDPGCDSPSDPFETSSEYPCDDGLDNDADGSTDYRPGSATHDPGCVSVEDGSEREADLACDDGQDNDGDGEVDYSPAGDGDPGCDGPGDTSEFGDLEALPCDNGVDDDADGYIDYRVITGAGDPGCSDPRDDDEKYQPPPLPAPNAFPCDDGQDNDVDGYIDGQDPGCRQVPAREDTYNPYEVDEYNLAAQCDDNRDNDGDGYKDYKVNGTGDPECLSPMDNSEDQK